MDALITYQPDSIQAQNQSLKQSQQAQQAVLSRPQGVRQSYHPRYKDPILAEGYLLPKDVESLAYSEVSASDIVLPVHKKQSPETDW